MGDLFPADKPRCVWCGKNRKSSDWEQQSIQGDYQRLCIVCARSRLGNPYNALLPMRKVACP